MYQQVSRGFIKNLIAKNRYALFIFLFSLIIALSCRSSTLAQAENKEENKQPENYFSVISKAGILRWPSSAMPLHVFIKPGDTTDGFRPVFITLLQQAFSEWTVGSENRVRFVLTNDPNNAQIVCGWTSDKNDMTKLTEGGHALVVPEGHNIKLVQITILTKSPSGEDLTDQFFKRVALHEIGHALGITDHSPNPADMMYGNPPSTTICCALSNRDKNTINILYSLDQTSVDRSALDMTNMLPSKDNTSTLARVIRLNAEASKAMQSKNLALAVEKLEEAHHIDPNNDLVNSNLGAAYGNCAMVAAMIHQNQRAQVYFNKAIPLLAKGPNQENYLSVLKYYATYLRSNNKALEADKIEKKIKTLSTH